MSATYFHVGDKYGHLEVIAATNEREKHGGSIIWKFKCDCGNIVYRSTQAIKTSLIRGHVISCGCKNPMACDPVINMLVLEDKDGNIVHYNLDDVLRFGIYPRKE